MREKPTATVLLTLVQEAPATITAGKSSMVAAFVGYWTMDCPSVPVKPQAVDFDRDYMNVTRIRVMLAPAGPQLPQTAR